MAEVTTYPVRPRLADPSTGSQVLGSGFTSLDRPHAAEHGTLDRLMGSFDRYRLWDLLIVAILRPPN